MSNESQMRLHCMANGDLPVLVQGMAGIGTGGCERIEEHSRAVIIIIDNICFKFKVGQ